MTKRTPQIAVIGSGISGIMAAYHLSKLYKVALYEKEDRIGGHTNTFTIGTGPDSGTGIDTGFIVLNDRTYPTLHSFFKELGVQVRYSDMSFGFYCENSNLQYAAPRLRSLFADRKNIFSLRHIGLIREMSRFNAIGRRALLEDGIANDEKLSEFIARHKISDYFTSNYLIPMAAAIWSSPDDLIMDFPVKIFLRFFHNHGLLDLFDRPRWQTVVGGSKSYLDRFKEQFAGDIHTGCGVKSVSRGDQYCTIVLEDGRALQYDYVVIATHADQALRLFDDPSKDEKKVLGVWSYQTNHTVLHSDTTFLPPLKDAGASWNYRREKGATGKEPLSITYDMNRLQGLNTTNKYFVTLNGERRPRPDTIHYEITYQHPVYTPDSVSSQENRTLISGVNRTYFCGSYFGFGFHEDGAVAGLQAANQLGAGL